MEKTMRFGDQTITYTVKKSVRAKSVRIHIDQTRGILLTVPRYIPIRFAEIFLQKKSAWVLETIEHLRARDPKKIIPYSRDDYQLQKKKVLELIQERMNIYYPMYQFPYKAISIRNQTSVWGSCSRQGNLQFNYKLIYVPLPLLDYVVVHELCHLQEHNHSARFWALVAKTIPDYKEKRKALRQHQLAKR